MIGSPSFFGRRSKYSKNGSCSESWIFSSRVFGISDCGKIVSSVTRNWALELKPGPAVAVTFTTTSVVDSPFGMTSSVPLPPEIVNSRFTASKVILFGYSSAPDFVAYDAV